MNHPPKKQIYTEVPRFCPNCGWGKLVLRGLPHSHLWSDYDAYSCLFCFQKYGEAVYIPKDPLVRELLVHLNPKEHPYGKNIPDSQ